MDANQILDRAVLNDVLEGLRRGRSALTRIQATAPIDAMLQVQTRQVMVAVDSLAETLTGNREYLRRTAPSAG